MISPLGRTIAHYFTPLTTFEMDSITATVSSCFFAGLNYQILHFYLLAGKNTDNWSNFFPPLSKSCKVISPRFESWWLMNAKIIVQNKQIKGNRCMSTQVSFKQYWSVLDQVTNVQAPYLSPSRVPALIICKWPSWKAKEGRSLYGGHGENEPWRWGRS